MRPRTRTQPKAGRSRIAAPKAWADAVRAFLDHHRTRRRSELTLRWYRADLDQFAAWHREARGEGPDYRAIDAEAMLDFQEHLAGKLIESRDAKTGKKVKAEAEAGAPGITTRHCRLAQLSSPRCSRAMQQ